MRRRVVFAALLTFIVVTTDANASGHGPVFGAATPTLGRGAWSFDQAWTMRVGDDSRNEQMFKTMVTFGVTETLQVSTSVPLLMSDSTLPPARMMNAMSNDRELESLIGWRFQRKPIGIGGRRESTLYVGGTIPFEHTRFGVSAGPSLVLAAATGYAGRTHYLWFGGAWQHYFESDNERLGDSKTLTLVYGYRPPVFRAEGGRPDLRLFIESTFEHRQPLESSAVRIAEPPRTLFIGPTSLWVYKAIALSGGAQWAVNRGSKFGATDRIRVAVNFSYFLFR
jgi:hypothetical protein